MNYSKIKHIFAGIISIIPSSKLKIICYSNILKYKFGKNCTLGRNTIIAVDNFECGDNVIIGRNNSFLGPMSVKIGGKSFIGRWNKFECSPVTTTAEKKHMNYARKFELGENCLIHESHYFDVYGLISIGSKTWVAGRDSQFWTHGASAENRNIKIGSDCYLGSAIRVAPGITIGDKTIVGLGSILTASIDSSNVIVGGNPAKIIRDRPESKDKFSFERWDNE